ncbi:extracellular solute-binding protein [Rhizobium cauense]|nr:extracellular solute-binding protein [Rhizobium cauense]
MYVRGAANYLVIPFAVVVVIITAACASAGPLEHLIAAAKEEGQLNVVALPRDWCGYGAIIDGFKAKFGIRISERLPDASSTKVIEEIKKPRVTPGADTVDVIDVGVSFAVSAKREGLLLPHKVPTWSTIPNAAKDGDGYWYGAYYGSIVFEVNSDIVLRAPMDWPDLLSPEYRNMVALAGDLASNQAILSVFAAGLSAGQGDPDHAASRGMRYFAELNRVGNFVPIVGNQGSLVRGRTPILVRWNYLALADREELRGKTRIAVITPRTGVLAGVYAQAISASAPHPNAARLWMTYLYSDETQLAFLQRHCHPIRLADLARRGKVPSNIQKRLAQFPSLGTNGNPYFPSVEEEERARQIITKGWEGVVGTQIPCHEDGASSDVPMVLNKIINPQCYAQQ